MHANNRLGIINSFQLFVAQGGFIERKTLRGIIADTIIFTIMLLCSSVIFRVAEWTTHNINRLLPLMHQYAQVSFIFGFVLLAATVAGGLLTARTAHAAAGINPELSFEGKVVDASGQNIPDGTYNMEFKVYQDGTSSGAGSTLKWTEDRLVSAGNGVTFNSGTFQVNLGSVNPFGASVDWNQDTLWLSLQVGNTSSCSPFGSCGGDGEMTPFIRLTATPYAMNADKLDGIDSSGFVQLGAAQSGNVNIGSGTITSGAINGISIGSTIQPSAAGALTVKANGANALTLTGGAASTWSTTAGALTITSAAATIWSTSAGNLTIQAGSGTVSLGSSTTLTATGALTVQAGGANALTLTGGAASTLSTSAGNLTLQAGSGTVSLGSSTSLTATGALTVQSGGAGALTITSGSGIIALGSATVQRAATTLTLDVSNASNSTFDITNSGAGGVNVSLDAGGSYTGAGAVTLSSGGANALSLDTGGGAAINIGGTNATSIVIGGNTAAAITEKVANSSTTAFTLQTAGGTSLLVANTTGGELYVGGSTAVATPELFVFGQKSATGDPTGVNGSEYYNSANNKFRCDQGGIWSDCISGFNTLTKTADQASTVNTTTMEADNTLVFAMKANTTYAVSAWIPIDDSNTGADEQYTFVTPAGATLNLSTLRSSVVAGTANITCNIIASAQACQDTGTVVNSAIDFIQVQGFVRNGGTAGNLQFEFAQRASTNALFPVIKKGATMTWHQSN
jgi:hypothetical protein